MKKFLNFIFSTRFLMYFMLAINVACIFVVCCFPKAAIVSVVVSIVLFLILIFSLNNPVDNPSYKVIWALLISILPLFGLVLFVNLKSQRATPNKRKLWNDIHFKSSELLEQDMQTLTDIRNLPKLELRQNLYILSHTGMPVYDNTYCTYLPTGHDYLEKMIESLKKAEKYIFMESFIVAPGKIWNEIFEILKEKAQSGIEIKLLIDDTSSLYFPDKTTFDKLNNHGIETVVFNKMARISRMSNHRDKRKLIIIDGKVCYTGSINIADEYANITENGIFYKDSGIMIQGKAVWNYIVMFLNMWQFSTENKYTINYLNYKSTKEIELPKVKEKDREFVQPFGTTPFENDLICRNTFLNMINSAKYSIKLTSPDFILDDEMSLALRMAAKSGIDISIVLPSKSDKDWLFSVSRAYLPELIKCGVKIYQYTPGLIHSKLMICDSYSALIGSLRFDFRNMYLNFENGVLIHRGKIIKDMDNDFNNLLTQCHLLTLKDLKKLPFKEKFKGSLGKFFAPIS